LPTHIAPPPPLSTQRRLAELNVFLVGAGAIGCEMLKNLACMGVATGHASSGAGDAGAPSGVVVTDMDRIEKSNLSRQFLFRNTDIGKAKSTTALAAAKAINPALHGVALESKVG